MLAKFVADGLQNVCNEFLAREVAPKSTVPPCKCKKCVEENRASHFLISWQMAFHIYQGSTGTALNQIFVTNHLANHIFTEPNLGFIGRLAKELQKNNRITVQSQTCNNKIQVYFSRASHPQEDLLVEFIVVQDFGDLYNLWDLKTVSKWASLSYCPNSSSYLLERKALQDMNPESLPRLDSKMWNPSKQDDYKQLLFLIELSCVLDQDFQQSLQDKMALVKESILLDCSAKADQMYFSQQVARFASCAKSFRRLIRNCHLLQLETENLCGEPFITDLIEDLENSKIQNHRLIGLFYLFNGIQRPSDEAEPVQQAKIQRNFELLFSHNNLWGQYVSSYYCKSENSFQELRSEIESSLGLSNAFTSDNFYETFSSAASDFESTLSEYDEERV